MSNILSNEAQHGEWDQELDSAITKAENALRGLKAFRADASYKIVTRETVGNVLSDIHNLADECQSVGSKVAYIEEIMADLQYADA